MTFFANENQIIPSKLEEYELFHCLFSEIPALSSHISLGQNREHCKSSETVVKRKEEFFLQSGHTKATNFNGRARM